MVGVSSLAGDTLQKNLYILVKENLPCFMGKKKHFHTRGCLQIRFQIMDECPNTNVFVPLGFKLPKGKPFGLPFPTRIHI
jgi:hypothetical protein